MSARRFLAFLLGVWLGGSLLVSVAAIHNLGSVESRLDSLSPAAAKLIEPLGHDLAGRLLRHHSSELNRAYFEQWGMAQLAIGVAVFVTEMCPRPLRAARGRVHRVRRHPVGGEGGCRL